MLERLNALPEEKQHFFPFYQTDGSFAFRKDGKMPVIWKITIEKKSGKGGKGTVIRIVTPNCRFYVSWFPSADKSTNMIKKIVLII